ncbi:MAG: 3-oxoacyl-[acyl-carrier-protein] reductase FabG [Candidatus Omnitrophica bacterium]|nr:3-oxoacyl-[acyl-carrier-protein] reductase FabG [Candidatus Omnitrophota bacterium]
MDLGIKGKRALVTGAGRGIGRAVAAALAREGAHVAAVARTLPDIESLLKELKAGGGSHYGEALDLMPEGAAAALARRLPEKFGPVDIVVHNVGGTLDITDPYCPLSDWRKVWRHNVEIALELNEVLLPSMRQRKWGRVVHVASIAAAENQGPVTYCTAKAALTAYTRSMGRVVAADGIAMSAVLPGAIYTEGGYWDKASKERPEHVRKYLSERMAIGRFGTLDEIRDAVCFLCSQNASFCVGSILPVDGGQGRTFFFQ